MNEQGTFEVKFACPACQGILTIPVPEAKGPCPFCNQIIEVSFSARLGESNEDERHFTRHFEGRRFRPSKRA